MSDLPARAADRMASTVRPRARRAARFALLGGGGALALSGCTAAEWRRLGLPDPKTEEAPTILRLWQGSWIAAGVIGLLVLALILFAVVAYRRKADDEMPPQLRYNIPIEVLYTVTPLIVIAALFFFTVRDQTALTRVTNEQDHTVNVVAFKWSWTFNYVDEQTYDVGTPGQRPTLWLPVDEKVRFELTSPDVIHSFWVPNFLFKMDVIPGRRNVFEVTPNAVGTYVGKCAELCGVDHSRMLFDVKVVSRADFDAHMADLRSRGQQGLLTTGRVDTNTTDKGVNE